MEQNGYAMGAETAEGAAANTSLFSSGLTALRAMKINVSQAERWGSAAIGTGLMAYGLRKRSWKGAVFALVGGGLVLRGVLGRSVFYRLIGINTATGHGLPGQDKTANLIRVDKSIVIARAAEDLYRHLRELDNLSAIFKHVKSVSALDAKRSRWTARMPAGLELEWEAEIREERPGRKLAWHSSEESPLRCEAALVIDPLAGGRSQLGVHLEYELPAGKAGRVFARLFGKHPDRLIDEELHRFKSRMETGG